MHVSRFTAIRPVTRAAKLLRGAAVLALLASPSQAFARALGPEGLLEENDAAPPPPVAQSVTEAAVALYPAEGPPAPARAAEVTPASATATAAQAPITASGQSAPPTAAVQPPPPAKTAPEPAPAPAPIAPPMAAALAPTPQTAPIQPQTVTVPVVTRKARLPRKVVAATGDLAAATGRGLERLGQRLSQARNDRYVILQPQQQTTAVLQVVPAQFTVVTAPQPQAAPPAAPVIVTPIVPATTVLTPPPTASPQALASAPVQYQYQYQAIAPAQYQIAPRKGLGFGLWR